MRYDEKQKSVAGVVPEFGAIFMSNSTTKKECFRRKLFGLPSSCANFVKQVKAGMILFLFEFERRELYGVFQALSDGGMNIMPHAYSSVGKQFPAQVKMTPIWYCTPLSEGEFCYAIKENYFSANKFNFGLSEDQVHRLLSLFSSRKLKDQPPQRQLLRNDFLRTNDVITMSRHSSTNIRRATHDGGFVMSDGVKDEGSAERIHEPVISTDYHSDSFRSVGRVTEDARFALNAGTGNGHRLDGTFGAVKLNEHFRDPLAEAGGTIDDVKLRSPDVVRDECGLLVACGQVSSTEQPEYTSSILDRHSGSFSFPANNISESEHNMDNGLRPAIPMDYPLSFPYHQASSFPNRCILKPDSLVHDQIPNLYYPTSCGDAIVTSTSPYNPDAPGINYRGSSAIAANDRYTSGFGYAPSNCYVGNMYPSFENKSLLSNAEPIDTSRCSDVNSGNYVPLPCWDLYSESVDKYCGGEDDEGFSLPKPCFTSMHLQGNVSRGGINRSASSYFFSLSDYSLDYGGQVALPDNIEHKMPEHENNSALATNATILKEAQCQTQDRASSSGPKCSDHWDNALQKYEEPQSFGKLYSDCDKKKTSVFSRLAFPDVCVGESGITKGHDERHIDSSTDEFMTLLYESNCQWLKTKKLKPLKRRYTAVATFRNKKSATFNSKPSEDNLSMISKETETNANPYREKNVSRVAEQTPFLDFKRRSEVKKTQEEHDATGCNGNTAGEGSTGGQRKRRKLIRPNFCKNGIGVNGGAPPNLQVSSLEDAQSKSNIGSGDAIAGSFNDENKKAQNSELEIMMCQNFYQNNNTDSGSYVDFERDKEAESCGAPLQEPDDEENGPSEKCDIIGLPISVPHNSKYATDDKSSSCEELLLCGFSQDGISASQSVIPDLSLKIEDENNVSGTGASKSEHQGGNEEKSVESVNEPCVTGSEIGVDNMMSCSHYQNPNSEMSLKELSGIRANGD